LRQDSHAEARYYFLESLRPLNEEGSLSKFIITHYAIRLGGLGGVAAATGLPAKAARLFGAAVAQGLDPSDQSELNHYIALARGQLDAASFDTAWAEGQAMTLEQAVGYALADDADGHIAVV
jgi:hypothetical protein